MENFLAAQQSATSGHVGLFDAQSGVVTESSAASSTESSAASTPEDNGKPELAELVRVLFMAQEVAEEEGYDFEDEYVLAELIRSRAADIEIGIECGAAPAWILSGNSEIETIACHERWMSRLLPDQRDAIKRAFPAL